jgi:tRNA pseudouridine55 synthase
VTVHELRLKEIVESEYPEIRFDVLCSKGTYIRTLCVDLGKALGAPAHMSSLVRTASGPFRSEDCFGFEELEEIAARGDWERAIIPLSEVLGQLPALMVSVEEAKQVFDGISLLPGEIPGESRLVRVLDETGRFLALYRWLPDGTAKPEKVFRDVE